jgi:hypothetical protein
MFSPASNRSWRENVTDRFAKLNTPLTSALVLELTCRGTISPSLKHTPSNPSMTILALHCSKGSLFSLAWWKGQVSCCIVRPRGTLLLIMTVILFRAPGHGVLCRMLVAMKRADSGDRTGPAASVTVANVSRPHTLTNRISTTDAGASADLEFTKAN